MPVQDFPAKPGEYNWGYWTSLFDVPEESLQHRSKRFDMAAIRELRQTIQAFHSNGIRVILDVVYNHTSSTGRSIAV